MKKFPFSILILKELYTFAKRVLGIISIPLTANTYVKALCQDLSKAITDLEKAMGKALTSEFTSLLLKKDKIRDDVYIGLRDFILAFTRSQISAKASAALYLMQIMENIGLGIYRHPYAIQTAETNSLIFHLKTPEATAALNTLGGIEWLDQLVLAQNDFEVTYKDKNAAEAAIDHVLAATSKSIITQYMDSILNYMDGYSNYEPELFNPLNAQIEEVITDVLAQARLRITLAAKNKEEEESSTTLK